MRHTEPKFKANQKVNCEWIGEGAIKGLRREAQSEFDWDTNKEYFTNPEWEYLIYSFKKDGSLDTRSPWGWVEESELLKLN